MNNIQDYLCIIINEGIDDDIRELAKQALKKVLQDEIKGE